VPSGTSPVLWSVFFISFNYSVIPLFCSKYMRTESLLSRYNYGRPIPVQRLALSVADSTVFKSVVFHIKNTPPHTQRRS